MVSCPQTPDRWISLLQPIHERRHMAFPVPHPPPPPRPVTGWVVCCVCVCVFLVTQSCPSFATPASLPCQWNFPGKNTGVGCHSLLQGIFLTQGPNPGLLHYRQIFHCLSHQRRPHAESCVSPKLYTEVLTPSTAKCDYIWKEDF